MTIKSLLKRSPILLFLAAACLFSMPVCAGLCQPAPKADPALTLSGKIFLQKHGKSEWVVLHAKNSKAYLLIGDLLDNLKAISSDKNPRIIVTLTGSLDGKSNVSCKQQTSVEADAKGNKKTSTKVNCIRYHVFDVLSIDSAAESDETIPAPLPDVAAGQKALRAAEQAVRKQGIMGEIYGRIKSCNIQSVPKTIDVQNADRTSPLKSLTVIITADTRIVKKIGQTEPSPLLAENLKPGQRVTVVYTRNEIRSEAMFITVTKE
ncbi:MAG: hypothetical protein MUC52_00455 [Candidatus Omnitrophica bacterium]|jgi:hypothetical protein|nr:hypothetical protein [Candidatus Omnitrophota bacterium]